MSRVGASKRVILVVPIIQTTVPLVPEMYLAAFSFIVKSLGSAYFLVNSMMAAPVSTIIRPCMDSPLGWSPHVTCYSAILMQRYGWYCC